MTPRIAVILAAGGRGSRFAADVSDTAPPKQFLQLRGHPIFVWSLRILLSSPAVSEAVIAAPPDMVAESKRQLDRYSEEFAGKSIKVVPGGATRQESVYLGLVELDNDPRPDYVLVHDAARPFITRELVERSVNGAIEYGAFSTGMPPADTIKRIEGSEIKETLDRSNLILVQTPQGGRFDWLLAAHKKAAIEGAATTDDAAILEAAGHRVSIIRGASFNLKITQPDDLVLAEALADIVCR